MAQNRGGLSSVDEIEEEEEVVEEQPAKEPGLGVMVGSGKSAMLASPSTLEAMAELYNQRAAKQSGFMEALKDAAAWTGGGIHGPTETLKIRDEQRSKQASELFSMQNQIAQHRQAMADSNIFLGTPQQTAAAQGQATATDAGAAPQMGRVGGLVDMIKDPNLKRQISHLYATDKKAAHQQLNKYLMESSPMTGELARRVNMIQNDPNISDDDKAKLVTNVIAGSDAFKPIDVRTTKGTIQKQLYQTVPTAQGTPAANAIKNPAPPPLPQQAQQAGMPAAATGAAPPPGAAPRAAPPPGAAPRAALPPGAAPRAAAAAPAPAPAQPTPATMAPSSGVIGDLGLDPVSKEELDLRVDLGKAKIAGIAEESKEVGKEAGMSQNAMNMAGKTAPIRLASIQNVSNIIDRHTKAAGPLSKPGMLPAVLTVVQDGISAGNFGQVGMPGIEKAVRQLGGGQAEIDAAQELGREFAKMQLANAQSFLKGQGAVSDAERRLISDMSGRTGDSPTAIRRFMQWEKKAAEYDRDLHKDYTAWRRANRGASFEEFKLTPSYEEKSARYAKDLIELANQPLPVAAKPGAKKSLDSHPGRSLLDKYPKR
jgi:hypothetical protein